MVGPSLTLALALAWASTATAPPRQDGAPDRPDSFPPLGREVPGPLVPKRPRTAREQERIDAVRLYAAARALEDRRELSGAIGLLERAREKDPDSVAILRRLGRLSLALGRVDAALDYGRQVLKADPRDTETLRQVMFHFRNDPEGASAFLKGYLENPDLEKGSGGDLLARRHLGMAYDRLDQHEKAAEVLAPVVEALDEKAANRLSPADQRRIVGEQPEETYRRFGEVFLEAGRFDLAARSFRRGLAYDPGDSRLPPLLARALWKSGKPAEALAALEPALKEKPAGASAYRLLAEILAGLGREAEVIPRLEEARRADVRNIGLRVALLERYRAAGEDAKAEGILRELLSSRELMTNRLEPADFRTLVDALRAEKKTADLLRLIERMLARPGGYEMVRPQIEALVRDPVAADEVLDAGLKLLEADPPGLDRNGRLLVALIASQSHKLDRLIELDRLLVKRDPSPQNYQALAKSLADAGRSGEAGTALEEMMAKFPATRGDGRSLTNLAFFQLRAGRGQKALDAAREAIRLQPENLDARRAAGYALVNLGRDEEAAAHFREWLESAPGNDQVESLARSGLSTAYVNLGQLDKGEAELEILYEKDPEDPGVNNDLGYLYAERGKKLEEAEAMIRKALELSEGQPGLSSYLDSLGWVLFKRGKLAEAAVELEKAAKSPDGAVNPTILDHLGDVYFARHEYDKARATWRAAETQAAKSEPPHRRLPEIRKKLDALDKLPRAPRPPSPDNP